MGMYIKQSHLGTKSVEHGTMVGRSKSFPKMPARCMDEDTGKSIYLR